MKKSTDQKLLAQQPNLESAIKFHQQGDLDKAEKRYRRILKLLPKHPDALHYLGVLMHQRGNCAGAIMMIKRALIENDEYVDAHNNLGNVYKEQKDLINAETHYRKALVLKDDFVSAHVNLALVLKDKSDFEQALKHCKIAIKLQPDNAQSYVNQAVVYRKMDNVGAAIDSYQRAISIDENHSKAYTELGRIFCFLGRHTDAKLLYKSWLNVDPTNAVARHMFASLSNESGPERASDAYVVETFNSFAASFDDILKKLEYQGPRLVGEAVESVYALEGEKIDILDAGCGTGLCGSYLSPYASRLIGVDLSQQMLDQAKAVNQYDSLICEELVQYLSKHESEFGLVISADTLCYFGILTTVFKTAFSALKGDGYLIFTVEHNTHDDQSYFLNPHGRYSHSETYIRAQLEENGFRIKALDFDMLRKERGAPVEGIVVVAIKTA